MIDMNRPAKAPDYSDTFSGPLAFADLTARSLLSKSLASTPRWFNMLFALRQFVAAKIGLDTGGEDQTIRALEKMPVLSETPTRFETGLADSHLDFIITVEKSANSVAITTDIWFNRPLGKIYLFAVLPAHKLILKHMVRTLGARP